MPARRGAGCPELASRRRQTSSIEELRPRALLQLRCRRGYGATNQSFSRRRAVRPIRNGRTSTCAQPDMQRSAFGCPPQPGRKMCSSLAEVHTNPGTIHKVHTVGAKSGRGATYESKGHRWIPVAPASSDHLRARRSSRGSTRARVPRLTSATWLVGSSSCVRRQ